MDFLRDHQSCILNKDADFQMEIPILLNRKSERIKKIDSTPYGEFRTCRTGDCSEESSIIVGPKKSPQAL
jgi:hypothetical protein